MVPPLTVCLMPIEALHAVEPHESGLYTDNHARKTRRTENTERTPRVPGIYITVAGCGR